MQKLTEKQKRFADYYIETGNATKAAVKAGYSRKTAKETGYENLTKPHISSYIEERNVAFLILFLNVVTRRSNARSALGVLFLLIRNCMHAEIL